MKNEVEDECGMMQILVANPSVVFRTHTAFGLSWLYPLLCQPQKSLPAMPSNACNYCVLIPNSLFVYTVSNLPCLQKEADEFLEMQLFGPQI